MRSSPTQKTLYDNPWDIGKERTLHSFQLGLKEEGLQKTLIYEILGIYFNLD